MEVQNDSLSNVITAGVVGFLGALLMIGLFYLYENKFWMVKQFYRTVLKKLIPSLYIQTQVHSESVTLTSRVNCQSVVIIENLPKCTTAKDLVKCLELKEFVFVKRLMKFSVAADKKGQCAGLAVAVCPRYCLQHSGILNKHNSEYRGNVIKVKEIKNRKINLKKQVTWLSSESWSHVGMKGRFQSYDDILHSITTNHGYYLVDGGNFVQYTDRVADVVEAAAASGVYKMVMKMKNPGNILDAEISWCQTYPGFLYMTAGICRNNAAEYRKDPSVWYTKLGLHLEKPTSNKYIVAIGECGISNILETKEIETKLFEHMVILADLHKKPILVNSHNVDAMLEVLDKYPGVSACLNIGFETVRADRVDKWIKNGYYLGISAGLWFGRQENVLKAAPLDKLILQSNSPYLTNCTSAYKVNYISKIKNRPDFKGVHRKSIELFNRDRDEDINFEPCQLMVVVELLASCLNKSPISLTSILNANAEKFYKFDACDAIQT